ncbi:glutamine--fructose-6-phosphate transaminase (isomerizing) [Thalassobaculum sp. OXR-137]|nr:glutamine--fructose-6-phosphate transaminase (isomerizing) [Thalassobaculum sp. OXR-137]WPZ33947.1 glutamine--fructose-6-phosphate transaminase (isomerizing) [Thalassobaculum sp. OXR-137]
MLSGEPAVPLMMDALRRLEYRGYDSAGVATVTGDTLSRRRAPGKLSALQEVLEREPLKGVSGIGHTRWATHGPPNLENAHPHVAGRVAVVHNGIIENHAVLRAELKAEGAVFESATDTEVVAHLLDREISGGATPQEAMARVMPRLTGAFAFVVLIAGEEDLMLAARRASPLAIGIGDGAAYVGSDAVALAPLTRRIVYLQDGDWAVLRRSGVSVFIGDGTPVERTEQVSTVSAAMVGKGNFRHFMEKEIHDQPEAIAHTLHAVIDPGTGEATLPGPLADAASVAKITILAAGTSFYAGLTARYWLESIAGIACEVELASEFRDRKPVLPAGGVAIAVSQSGESLDTLMALRHARTLGQKVLALVNVPESTIAREADGVLLTRAGPEFGVASTKAFTAQLTAFLGLAIALGFARGHIDEAEKRRLVSALEGVPSRVAAVLKDVSRYQSIAHGLSRARDVLYLGRGLSYPIALEGALKLKEITYVHAEGYAAGEMKHGPIALIEDNVPVVIVAPSDGWFDKTASNMAEVRARGGRVILLTDAAGARALGEAADEVVVLPDIAPEVAPILYSIPVQLLAYLAAVEKGTDADQPRNLAKSVTVE